MRHPVWVTPSDFQEEPKQTRVNSQILIHTEFLTAWWGICSLPARRQQISFHEGMCFPGEADGAHRYECPFGACRIE